MLQKAQTAKEANEESTALEKIQVEVAGSYGLDGKIDVENQLNQNLKRIEGLTYKGKIIEIEGENKNIITKLPATVKLDGYEFKIDEFGAVEKNLDFSLASLPIGGNSINTDKYGWKVKNYNVTTNEFTTGVWRLFYQDTSYAYLITDECVGSYKLSTLISSYANGATVSNEGKLLNSAINELFTESNVNGNIRATAWLTDTSEEGHWAEYKNNDAIFAIGSPTYELFAASFNTRSNKSYLFNISNHDSIGYSIPEHYNKLKTDENHGIYNKNSTTNWWLASPIGGYAGYQVRVKANEGHLIGYSGADNIGEANYSVRPIVCIPTKVFNSKYGTSTSLVDE